MHITHPYYTHSNLGSNSRPVGAEFAKGDTQLLQVPLRPHTWPDTISESAVLSAAGVRA